MTFSVSTDPHSDKDNMTHILGYLSEQKLYLWKKKPLNHSHKSVSYFHTKVFKCQKYSVLNLLVTMYANKATQKNVKELLR